MAGEIIRRGDATTHGSTVIEGSLTDICHGKPIAFLGHRVHCPKCSGDFPIVEGVMTTSFYGKGVAVAGMKTACGATLVASQFTDTVEYAGGASAAAASFAAAGTKAARIAAAQRNATEKQAGRAGNDDTAEKSITRIFWTYGADELPVADISRHYVDLNLHIETVNYAAGETALVVVKNDDGAELVAGSPMLEFPLTIGPDGSSKRMNVFQGRTLHIGSIG